VRPCRGGGSHSSSYSGRGAAIGQEVSPYRSDRPASVIKHDTDVYYECDENSWRLESSRGDDSNRCAVKLLAEGVVLF
jgi:hypothetical protein